MIYLFAFILLLIPVVKYDWMAKTGGEKGWYYLNLIVLILIAGLRYRVGGDTLMYMAMYDEWPALDELKYFDFEESKYNPLWYIYASVAKWFSEEFWVLQMMQSVIVNSIFFWFFKKYSPLYYFSAILVYFLGYYCYFNMEIMREILCISLMLLATSSLLEKKLIRYYLVCFVAVNLHYSALIMFLMPFAIWLFKKPSWILQLSILIVVFVALNILNLPAMIVNALPLDGQLSHLILSYIEIEISAGSMLYQLLLFLPVLGVIFIRTRIPIKDKFDLTPLVMASVFVYTCSIRIAGFSRFINYFVPFIIVYIVNTVYPILCLKFKELQVTYLVLMSTLVIYGFDLRYYYMRDMSDYYPNTTYYTIFYPYNSILDKKINEKRERFIENYREVQLLF